MKDYTREIFKSETLWVWLSVLIAPPPHSPMGPPAAEVD